MGGWRVVMSVGGPCPHEAVQAEGHDDEATFKDKKGGSDKVWGPKIKKAE